MPSGHDEQVGFSLQYERNHRKRARKATRQRLVAVFSFSLQSNTFNPQPRRLDDFQRLEGAHFEAELGDIMGSLRRDDPELCEGVDVRFLCLYRGGCGGVMPAADFEQMKSTAVDRATRRDTNPYAS